MWVVSGGLNHLHQHPAPATGDYLIPDPFSGSGADGERAHEPCTDDGGGGAGNDPGGEVS